MSSLRPGLWDRALQPKPSPNEALTGEDACRNDVLDMEPADTLWLDFDRQLFAEPVEGVSFRDTVEAIWVAVKIC